MPCPCCHPLPGAAMLTPTPLPSAPAGLRPALHRGATSLLRGSAKGADLTAAGAKISEDTHTQAWGETLCRPVGPAPLPARRGGSARLRCGRGAAAAPEHPRPVRRDPAAEPVPRQRPAGTGGRPRGPACLPAQPFRVFPPSPLLS